MLFLTFRAFGMSSRRGFSCRRLEACVPRRSGSIRFICNSTLNHRRSRKNLYKYGPYILVGESGQGIHVFDNNDPSNPVSIAFVNVPLNEDMAIRNDVMFIDIGRDVAAVDVSDWANVQEIGRLSGFIYRSDALYPEGQFGYFECVDTSRGVVVDWVSEELVNPKCRR